jgi:hypothetical protein
VGAAARAEVEGRLEVESGAEAVGQAGGEGVAAAVGVHDRAGRGDRVPAAGRPIVRRVRAAALAVRDDDVPGARVETADVLPLGGVGRAADERVELDVGIGEGVDGAHRGDEHPGAAGVADRLRVAGGEVDGVAGELAAAPRRPRHRRRAR